MKFDVSHYTPSEGHEWLNTVSVNTLEELEEKVKELAHDYHTEVEVDFIGKTIYVGEQIWYETEMGDDL